jgi:hypothetical protein
MVVRTSNIVFRTASILSVVPAEMWLPKSLHALTVAHRKSLLSCGVATLVSLTWFFGYFLFLRAALLLTTRTIVTMALARNLSWK